MNARDFYKVVVKMREAQTTYAKYPYPHLRDDVAKYEAMVDAEIKRVEEILKRQAEQAQGKLL